MITTLQIADRGVVLELGRLGASGSGVEMLDDPEIRSAYLGIQG
jgi:ABC-type branched-subunit amino acid transport system ATPase component